jgi:translation initiation factor IF-3
MDLIEISPNAEPPVCRITNYGKYKYELEKKEKQSRKHHSVTKVKEVKFHANVDDHDFQTKIRHIRDFVAEGHRVKVSLMFRGREQAHQEIGYQVMRRVIKDVQDVASNERSPEQVGRSIYMMITPRPATKGKPVQPAAPPPA